jgi:hypothetical protein
LAREKDDRPRFQLLQMRYTGTALTGQQGEGGFFNLVQIAVVRPEAGSERLHRVRQKLGGRGTVLDPMPMAGLEAFLVMPMGKSDGRYQRIGSSAGWEESRTAADWTERTFTVRLAPHEAQLLWDQVATGHLGLSISYAYFANVVGDVAGSYEVRGDSASVNEITEWLNELTELDSIATPYALKAGAVPLSIDVDRWPELLKKIDLNDGAPPTWAFLEVRCYDFANALRPDLAMKKVEVEATGVDGRPVRIPPIRFLAGATGDPVRQVRFPYAVDITQPYRLRVTEYTSEGEARAGRWTDRADWTGLLDLTTPPAELPYQPHLVEVEVDTAAFRAAAVQRFALQVHFARDGRPHRETLAWESLPTGADLLRQLDFYADRDAVVHYLLTWQTPQGNFRSPPRRLGQDGYLYLKPG